MRICGLALTMLAVMVTFLSAGDRPTRPDAKEEPAPQDKKAPPPDEKKADEPKKADGDQPAPMANTPTKAKEIIDRLNKNLETAEERLDKKDPGKDTRQIQDDIIKDLDELLKQQQNQKGGGGSKSVRKVTKTSQSSKSTKTAKQQPQDKSEGKKPNAAPEDAKTEKEKADAQLTKANDTSSLQNVKGDPSKAGNKAKKESSTVADLFRDVWGHLPQTKRQEMDAYSKERFMPKYDDLLRQYYRTIADQGKQSSGD